MPTYHFEPHQRRQIVKGIDFLRENLKTIEFTILHAEKLAGGIPQMKAETLADRLDSYFGTPLAEKRARWIRSRESFRLSARLAKQLINDQISEFETVLREGYTVEVDISDPALYEYAASIKKQIADQTGKERVEELVNKSEINYLRALSLPVSEKARALISEVAKQQELNNKVTDTIVTATDALSRNLSIATSAVIGLRLKNPEAGYLAMSSFSLLRGAAELGIERVFEGRVRQDTLEDVTARTLRDLTEGLVVVFAARFAKQFAPSALWYTGADPAGRRVAAAWVALAFTSAALTLGFVPRTAISLGTIRDQLSSDKMTGIEKFRLITDHLEKDGLLGEGLWRSMASDLVRNLLFGSQPMPSGQSSLGRVDKFLEAVKLETTVVLSIFAQMNIQPDGMSNWHAFADSYISLLLGRFVKNAEPTLRLRGNRVEVARDKIDSKLDRLPAETPASKSPPPPAPTSNALGGSSASNQTHAGDAKSSPLSLPPHGPRGFRDLTREQRLMLHREHKARRDSLPIKTQQTADSNILPSAKAAKPHTPKHHHLERKLAVYVDRNSPASADKVPNSPHEKYLASLTAAEQKACNMQINKLLRGIRNEVRKIQTHPGLLELRVHEPVGHRLFFTEENGTVVFVGGAPKSDLDSVNSTLGKNKILQVFAARAELAKRALREAKIQEEDKR